MENVSKWKQEIQEIEPEKPIVLVLTKADLPFVSGKSVTVEMMKEMQNQMGFAECSWTSSKKNWNVDLVFDATFEKVYNFKYVPEPKEEDD